MQGLPDDVRDPASAPAVTAERPADSSSSRPSHLKRWGDALILGLVAATLIRICSTLLASWLPTAAELAQPGYTVLRYLSTIIILPAALAIAASAHQRRTRSLPSSCYSYDSVPKLPAVVSGLLLAEFFSNYRGTSFFILNTLLPQLPQPTSFGISISPLTMLAILIHSAGILTVAALGYSIHTKSKLADAPGRPDNPVRRV